MQTPEAKPQLPTISHERVGAPSHPGSHVPATSAEPAATGTHEACESTRNGHMISKQHVSRKINQIEPRTRARVDNVAERAVRVAGARWGARVAGDAGTSRKIQRIRRRPVGVVLGLGRALDALDTQLREKIQDRKPCVRVHDGEGDVQ